VVAETAEEAAQLLQTALAKRGLRGPVTSDQFVLLTVDQPRAVVLLDGDY
jgi:protein involved in polysaccharide export with SLBB domain